MSDLFIIACGAGFRDGLNPCIFMACAVFIVYIQVLRKISFSAASLWIIFALFYALGILVFNFGPFERIILDKVFIYTAKSIYFVFGMGSFLLGVLYFKDWFVLRRGKAVEASEGEKAKKIPFSIADYLALAMLAIILSASATLWPMDKYVFVLGNASLIRGQWQEVAPLLLAYVFISMWALWFLWAFLNIKNLRPSLGKIICSAIFLTASTCVILVF